MITPAIKRYVKCISVERGAGVYIIACVCERTGDREVVVSEPRIIRFIPRSSMALALGTSKASEERSQYAVLDSGVYDAVKASLEPIVSPFSELFVVKRDCVIAFHGARPPTFL